MNNNSKVCVTPPNGESEPSRMAANHSGAESGFDRVGGGDWTEDLGRIDPQELPAPVVTVDDGAETALTLGGAGLIALGVLAAVFPPTAAAAGFLGLSGFGCMIAGKIKSAIG